MVEALRSAGIVRGMSKPPSGQAKRRFLIYFAVVLVLGVLFGVFGMWYANQQVGLELQELREELRAGGAPLGRAELLEDYAGREAASPPSELQVIELEDWLADFASARSPRWNVDRAEDDLLELLREECTALGLETELQAVAGCVDSEESYDLLRAALWDDESLGDLNSLDDCQRELLALLARLDHGSLAVAARAAELRPPRGVDHLGGEQVGASVLAPPVLPWVESLQVLERLALASKLSAAAGDAQGCLRYLEAGLAAAAIYRDAPMLVGDMLWSTSNSKVLLALELSLPNLPGGCDLSGVEQRLAALRPLEVLRHAFVSERAIVDGVLGQLEGDDSEAPMPQSFASGGIVWSQRDHLRYLRASEDCLASLDQPFPDSNDGSSSGEFWRAGAHVDMLLEAFGRAREQAVILDSERLKALAALRARRLGVEDARDWLAQHVDPLTGAAFRLRERADGTFVVLGETSTKSSHDWPLAPAHGQ